MSMTLMSEVWRLDPEEISASEAMVLLALADAADDQGRTWIAIQTRSDKLDLCRKSKLSIRAVQAAIKKLCAAGRLTREDKPGRGTIWTVTPAGNAGVVDVVTTTEAQTQSSPDQSPPTPPQEMHPRRKCTPAGNAGAPAGNAGNPKLKHLSSRANALSERGRVREPDSSGSGLEGFEAAFRLYPSSGRGVTSEPEAKAAWRVAVVAAGGSARLTAAVRAYAADPVLKRRDYGAPGFHKWLSERRWRAWLPEGDNPVRPLAAWTGPAEVRAAVAAVMSAGAVNSYLDQAAWDEGRRVVITATGYAADQLRKGEAGRALKALKVGVESRISNNSSERVRA